MYKSPIEIISGDIHTEIVKKQEEEVYRVVLHYFPNVDKAELLRALQYDRQQYEKGYADAKGELVRCKECASRVHDNASDEDWCNNPGGLCCQLKDDYFCPFGERRTE